MSAEPDTGGPNQYGPCLWVIGCFHFSFLSVFLCPYLIKVFSLFTDTETVFESPLVLAISISLAVLTLFILAALIACLVRNRAKKPQEPPDTAEVRHTLICPPAPPAQESLYSQKAGQPLPPPPTPVQWSLVYGAAGASGQGATYTDSSHYEGNNTYEVPRIEQQQQLQYSQQQQSPAGLSYARSHTAGSGGYPSTAASHSPHSYGGGSRQSGHSPSYHSGYGGGGGGGAYRHVDIY
jgi:hypothetical protein